MKKLSITPDYIKRLSQRGISEASSVQKQVIPAIRALTNGLVFRSETGSGKTLAYLLPLFEQLDAVKAAGEGKAPDSSTKAVKIIIAAPTHELASQIKVEIQAASNYKAVLLLGGSPIKRQVEALKAKPDFVVGAPSRILELIHLKKLKTEHVHTIILDEVDRLLAPELGDDTEDLVTRVAHQPNTTHTKLIACSATIKPSICSILDDVYRNPIETILLAEEDVLKNKITHWAIHAESRKKIDTLRSLLSALETGSTEKPGKLQKKVLVFTGRVSDVDAIVQKLEFKKVQCAGLHAKTDKLKRKQAIDRFKSGKCPVLITSDLAARGLDIQQITHVVHMDVPSNQDFFIHRSGRTARAGATGYNVIIGDEYEMRQLVKLEKKLDIIIYPKVLMHGRICNP
ncbi:MAG TPA: DEAD/DEAH box helicase [Treponemataceae bacterium]|nr:DEAD/DEAH box helicase [Treponemataceae bacterium]